MQLIMYFFPATSPCSNNVTVPLSKPRAYGHTSVSILNGGWAKRVAEDRAVDSDEGCPLKLYEPWGTEGSSDAIQVDTKTLANADDVLTALKEGEGKHIIVDARSQDQFTGEVRRAKRGGHIPGALNVPYRELLKVDPETGCDVLLNPDEMRSLIDSRGIDSSSPNIIAMCNGGVASTLILFALYQWGNTGARNYDGSWNEWGNSEHLPVVSAEE